MGRSDRVFGSSGAYGVIQATAAARRADAGRVEDWLAERPVLISSTMDVRETRGRGCGQRKGGGAAWFEEPGAGGRR